MFHKKINKNVNKQNIGNSENWLFDDVSEIMISFVFRNIKDPFKSYKTYFGTKCHICDLESCRGWSHVCTSSREHSVKMETIFKCYCQRSISPSSHNIVIEPYPAPASYGCTGFGVSLSGSFKKSLPFEIECTMEKEILMLFSIQRISANSFPGNYFFLKVKFLYSFHLMAIFYLLCGNYWRRESRVPLR